MLINLNPPRGFRDLYPEEKIFQDYIFLKLKKVSQNFGFSSYDGPILEDIKIYLGKTSRELIEKQTFQIKTKEDLLMRPEMTPTLARMIAKKAGELVFPLRLFNTGLRFRYEMPQKGRGREFYQSDFDILGANSTLSDAEIINVATSIFINFGCSEKDFVVYINSRVEMEKNFINLGFEKEQFKSLLSIIDKQDKLSNEEFIKLLLTIDNNKEKIQKLVDFLYISRNEKSPYFIRLFEYLKKMGIDQYCKVNSNITRGLDYYTGLVFEVREKGPFQLKRALLGGGRYDNLVSDFNPRIKIPGVGFATSDVVLWEFLQNKDLLPKNLNPIPTKVLVTIFSSELTYQSMNIVKNLRKNNINVELYLDDEAKLDKQLKYANKKNIPYVIIIGPEEARKNVVKLKDMKTGEQTELTIEQVIKKLC
jgi:histidyl-tRNA synthetase